MTFFTSLRNAFRPSPDASRDGSAVTPGMPTILRDDWQAEMDLRNPRPRVLRRACKRGHRLDEANAYSRPDGRLECRRCRALASKRYRTRLRLS